MAKKGKIIAAALVCGFLFLCLVWFFLVPARFGNGGSRTEIRVEYSDNTYLFFNVNETVSTDIELDNFHGNVLPRPTENRLDKKWKDISIDENGLIQYGEKSYDNIEFYRTIERYHENEREVEDGLFTYPLTYQGWAVSRQNHQLFLDNTSFNLDGLISSIHKKCEIAGLTDKEITLLTDVVRTRVTRLEAPHLVIEYDPPDFFPDECDLTLSTPLSFKMYKHHFLIEELSQIPAMNEPEIVMDNGTFNSTIHEIRITTSKAEEFIVQSSSPEIFFHVNEETTLDVEVVIPHGVSVTIPEVEMTDRANWENVLVNKNGRMTYSGQDYPYLYYEGYFSYPQSSFGWLISREEGKIYLDGIEVQQGEVQNFIKEKCLDSGLYPNEAQVILDRILNLDMLDFEGKYLAIRYIPMKDVDATMQLNTSIPFTIMRRHFLIEEVEKPVPLQEPIFEMTDDSDMMIHETAVNRK